jgi:protein-S-isoprenylcysteine O-methyltransferase Ste14
MESEILQFDKNKVHKVLASSYSVYLFVLLIGICLDLTFNFRIFTSYFATFVGVLFLVFGTVLIVWAQKTSRNLKKENISIEAFSQGPYRFSRTPTNFGLFFSVLGFGVVFNSPFIIVLSIIAFLIAKFVFLEKEEEVLAGKYGAPYLEYKKIVRF